MVKVIVGDGILGNELGLSGCNSNHGLLSKLTSGDLIFGNYILNFLNGEL